MEATLEIADPPIPPAPPEEYDGDDDEDEGGGKAQTRMHYDLSLFVNLALDMIAEEICGEKTDEARVYSLKIGLTLLAWQWGARGFKEEIYAQCDEEEPVPIDFNDLPDFIEWKIFMRAPLALVWDFIKAGWNRRSSHALDIDMPKSTMSYIDNHVAMYYSSRAELMKDAFRRATWYAEQCPTAFYTKQGDKEFKEKEFFFQEA